VYETGPANIPDLKQRIQLCLEAIPDEFAATRNVICQVECKSAKVEMQVVSKRPFSALIVSQLCVESVRSQQRL
jgi:hypothetical protein